MGDETTTFTQELSSLLREYRETLKSSELQQVTLGRLASSARDECASLGVSFQSWVRESGVSRRTVYRHIATHDAYQALIKDGRIPQELLSQMPAGTILRAAEVRTQADGEKSRKTIWLSGSFEHGLDDKTGRKQLAVASLPRSKCILCGATPHSGITFPGDSIVYYCEGHALTVRKLAENAWLKHQRESAIHKRRQQQREDLDSALWRAWRRIHRRCRVGLPQNTSDGE